MHVRRIMRLLIFFLSVLLLGMTAFVSYIYIFNHTERNYDSHQECKDFAVSITQRGGQTDLWSKTIAVDGETIEYKGAIYEITLQNTGKYNISSWKLKINIPQDLYINNAWCGQVEIHQKSDAAELVQKLDLRNYRTEEITIDYLVSNPDLLIPLHKGDCIVYYPDFATKEYPVYSAASGKVAQAVAGAIFYYNDTNALVFQDYQIEYYLEKSYTQSPTFWFLCLLALCWGIALIVFVIMRGQMKKNHLRLMQDESIIKQSIGVFTRFFEAKDTYTNGHSQRVALYSRMIAEKLNFKEDDLRKIYYIALMHDCGKCYIPDEILKKPGKLTEEEFEIIKNHPIKGAEMLEDFNSIEHIREGVLYHHERYDGHGYPTGKKGEEIPLVARIICVADSFDAMNSRRYYRSVLSKNKIIAELENNSGKQFDPRLVELFLELIREGKITFTKENED